MTAALAIHGLEFAWPGSDWALRLPELVLQPGDRLFLHGPSGTGKSTLLNLIAGTLTPRAGSIAVAGRAMQGLGGAARDRVRADHLGIVFQQFNLLPFLGLHDNVILPCRFSRRRAQAAVQRFGSVEAAATHLLGALGLGDPALQRRPVMQLSVGQQQRVAAARALIGQPALVLCDEPTSALDGRNRDQFIDLLFAECAEAGSALLFVSHDLSLAARFPRQQGLADLAGVAA